MRQIFFFTSWGSPGLNLGLFSILLSYLLLIYNILTSTTTQVMLKGKNYDKCTDLLAYKKATLCCNKQFVSCWGSSKNLGPNWGLSVDKKLIFVKGLSKITSFQILWQFYLQNCTWVISKMPHICRFLYLSDRVLDKCIF